MARTSKTGKDKKPSWVTMNEEELKEIIKELAEKNEPAKIGLILRDQYGIPTTKIYGKKLAKFLVELEKDTKPELKNAEKKVENLKEHLKKNVTDQKAKHKLQKAQSKLNIIRRYHKIPIKRKKKR